MTSNLGQKRSISEDNLASKCVKSDISLDDGYLLKQTTEKLIEETRLFKIKSLHDLKESFEHWVQYSEDQFVIRVESIKNELDKMSDKYNERVDTLEDRLVNGNLYSQMRAFRTLHKLLSKGSFDCKQGRSLETEHIGSFHEYKPKYESIRIAMEKEYIDDFEYYMNQDKRLDHGQLLCDASSAGWINIVKYLVIHKQVDINAPGLNNRQRNTSQRNTRPLLIACEAGREKVVEFLLRNGANINMKFQYGSCALITACKHGHAAVANVLIDHVGSTEKGKFVNEKDECGATALIRAARYGHKEVVGLLLKHQADINLKDKYGRMPISEALEGKHIDMVDTLLQNGAHVTEAYRRSLLLAATDNGFTDLVKVLIKNGADVNTRDDTGHSLISIAAEKAHVDTVEALIKIGADFNEKDAEDDETAVMKCIVKRMEREDVKDMVEVDRNSGNDDDEEEYDDDYNTDDQIEDELAKVKRLEENHIKILRILIEHGADLNIKDNNGRMALHKSLSEHDYNEDIAKILIKSGADVNARDRNNETALMLALHFGTDDLIRNLFEKGAEISNEQKYLLYAVLGGKKSYIEMCIAKGGDVNAKYGNEEETLLMKATRKGYKEIVEILIENNADINATSGYGHSALDIASKHREKDIYEYLKSKSSRI